MTKVTPLFPEMMANLRSKGLDAFMDKSGVPVTKYEVAVRFWYEILNPKQRMDLGTMAPGGQQRAINQALMARVSYLRNEGLDYRVDERGVLVAELKDGFFK